MPQIKRGNGLRLQTFRCGDNDGIDETELQTPMAGIDAPCASQILVATPFDGERSLGQISEKSVSGFWPKMPGRQVVDFGKNRPGQDPMAGFSS